MNLNENGFLIIVARITIARLKLLFFFIVDASCGLALVSFLTAVVMVLIVEN